jgi:hypothetical protein
MQVEETADLHAQVSSLVALRLLERVHTPDNIDTIRLRVCGIHRMCSEVVAKIVVNLVVIEVVNVVVTVV